LLSGGTVTFETSGNNFGYGTETFGSSGTGSCIQSNGANFSSALYLGVSAGSYGSYALSGGLLSAATAYSGSSGKGNFNQTGGTCGITGNLVLAANTGATGAFTLSGGNLSAQNEYTGKGVGNYAQSGGSNNPGNLYLGSANGFGGYTLSAGILSTSGEEIGYSGGTGVFVQTGGTNTAADLYIGNDQQSSTGNGAFTISGGTLTVSSGVIVGGGNGKGTLAIQGVAVTAGSVSNAGTISLTDAEPTGNDGLADLLVTGNFTQTSAGVLSFVLSELADNSQTALVDVGGTATFAGTLDVSLAADFDPAPGDRFEIIGAGSAQGVFSAVDLPGGTGSFSLSYAPTEVIVTAIPEPASQVVVAGAIGALCLRRPRKRRESLA